MTVAINVTYTGNVIAGNFGGGAAEMALFKAGIAEAVGNIQNVVRNANATFTWNVDVLTGNGALALTTSATSTVTYAAWRAAALANARSRWSIAATSTIPASTPAGSATFLITRPNAIALGLDTTTGSDGTTKFFTGFNWGYTQSQSLVGKFDFVGAAQHELTEAMGRTRFSSTATPFFYGPLDLFSWQSAGVRLWDFSSGYFSVDGGVSPINFYNTNTNDDQMDWSGSGNRFWAPAADCCNATTSGGLITFSTGDLIALDAVGWN